MRVRFASEGTDEYDAVQGDGWAVIAGPDAIRGEIRFRDGDATTFEVRRRSPRDAAREARAGGAG